MYIQPECGGSYEVFEVLPTAEDGSFEPGVGWYWWACWPGCLPDGEAVGPFPSEEAAMADLNMEIEGILAAG